MNIYTKEELDEAIRLGHTVDTDALLAFTLANMPKSYFNPRAKLHRYMVTFTLAEDPTEAETEIIEGYIISQFHRAPLKVVEAHMVKELTKSGRPHWHVVLSTSKPLKKDRFHYYIRKYGGIDISRTKAQNLIEGINYISKVTIPTKIV